MKFCFLIICLTLFSSLKAQHQVVKLWETDTTLSIPESVLPGKDVLFVSLIDGGPWDADGRGGVALVGKDGKIRNANWVTGLNAPKGMGLWKGKLYVADVSEVAVIDTASGKLEKKIPVDTAKGLNDITIDEKGTVYVSDSKLGFVYRILNNQPELYLTDLKGVNGLKSVGNNLYILTAKDVYRVGRDKKPVSIGMMESGGDGIEPVGNGDFIVTSWGGLMNILSKDGKMETLLDTRQQKKNTADIGYDPASRIIYIPTFFAKSVVAYQLK